MDAPAGTSFLVMTHNAGNGHARPPKLTQVLRESDADIIGLQEITAEQATALDTALCDVYPFRVLYGEGIPGKGFLSRFPITASRRLQFYPNRPDLWGQFDLGGRTLEIVNGHPWPPRIHWNGYYQGKETREHIRKLLALATSGQPTIVLGDFNFTETNEAYA